MIEILQTYTINFFGVLLYGSIYIIFGFITILSFLFMVFAPLGIYDYLKDQNYQLLNRLTLSLIFSFFTTGIGMVISYWSLWIINL